MINTCCNLYFYYNFIVHGGIRHLEIPPKIRRKWVFVHGGIRHLEIHIFGFHTAHIVHGGIRHLEISVVRKYF